MIFIHTICSIFDLFLIYIYIQQVMGKRKVFSPFLYALAFLGDEVLLTLCSFFVFLPSEQLQNIFTLILSFILTFALTLMHEGTWKHRLFVTVSFQVCATLSELVIVLIFSLLPQTLTDILESNNIYGAFCSKIILFLLCNIVMLFFKKRDSAISANYTALVLLMPVLSLILMLAIPAQATPNTAQTVISFAAAAGILIANIVNYFLLQNILKIQELHQIEQNLQKQISYQTGKYQQLSTAYRDTRRLIHDTKKHFFYIKNCVNEKNYDGILPYLEHSIIDMEKTFIIINTGNLVIDSFVSNYASIAKQEGIQFRTDIQINPNLITIRDYDLSIILGNLLDNSLAACRKIPLPAPRQITVELITSSQELLIHIENTIDEFSVSSKNELESLNHGYGTKNIESVALLYDGNYSHYTRGGSYHAIVSIPYHVHL